MRGWVRKLRGALGNAVVWAVAWMAGTLAFSVFPIVLRGLGVSWPALLRMVAQGGAIGFATGAVFSTVLGVAYRNRRLADIRSVPMGVLGAATAMFLPVGFWALTVAAGNPFPAYAAVPGIAMSGGVGWLTAAGSLRIAKTVERPPLESPESAGALPG